MVAKIALILGNIDNLLLNNYWRKFYTYKEIGWNEPAIKNYLAKKQYTMQVASFNTPTVTFSASSRRNRFYEIYNRPTMLDMDVPYDEHVIGVLNEIRQSYEIFVITSRKINLQPKTLEILTRLGFQVKNEHVFFLPENKNLAQFRQKTIAAIVQKYPVGIGISIDPHDLTIYARYEYPVYGFTSIKESTDFHDKQNFVVQSWSQLLSVLLTYAKNVKELAEKNAASPKVEINQGEEEKNSSESALEKVIFQQLFLGSANILGSMTSDYPPIQGFEETIAPFLGDVKAHLKLISSGQIPSFFQVFTEKFGIEFQSILQELKPTLDALQDQENSKFMQVYLVLTKFLEHIRENAFSVIGQNHIDQIFRKLAGKPLPQSHFQKIQSLIGTNDEKIVILYNLSFLTWLQKVYNLTTITSNLPQIFTKHANSVLVQLFF